MSEYKKMGKWMFIFGWVALLGLMTLVFGNWEKQKINPNQSLNGVSNSEVQRVTLQRNAYGHYVATGVINDQKVTFMLDTGATNVAVPEKLAERLKLQRGRPYQVYTANGTAQVYDTRLETLELGPLKLYDIDAAISPGMTGNQILLGMSALKQLEFSQIGDKLTLIQRFGE